MDIPTLHINNIQIQCISSFNFLSITIDKNLTLKEDINLLASKISRNVGIINRLKHYIPYNITDYLQHPSNTPTDYYGILILVFKSDRILKIEKKTLRSFTLSKYNAHTEPIFKTLKLLKRQVIFKL